MTWQDDFEPEVPEDMVDYSGHFGPIEEDYRGVEIDPTVTQSLLPVQGKSAPEGTNLGNKYHRLLSAETLQHLPAEVIDEIPFEGAEQIDDLPTLFRNTATDELQRWIDADEFLLPAKLEETLWQDIRRFKQEQGLV